MTQRQAAAAKGLGFDMYRLQEAGMRPGARVVLGGFKKREICMIRRRRMGWTQQELAEVLGVTKLWVHKMENGTAPVARLYSYWTE